MDKKLPFKDHIIMTIELAKYKSSEFDDNNLEGANHANSNDVCRFQFALDTLGSQRRYTGAGLLGGDLIGLKQKSGYLKQLGITTIVIYPFMQTDKHNLMQHLPSGYGITDWKKIDINFRGGGQTDQDISAVQQLINDLHDPQIGGRSLYVLQDLSISLCGKEISWLRPIEFLQHLESFKRWDPLVLTNNIGKDPIRLNPQLSFDLSSFFNSDIFSYDGAYDDGALDNLGHTFPAEECGSNIWGEIGNRNPICYELGLKLNGCNNAIQGGSIRESRFDLPPAKYAAIGLALTAVGDERVVAIRVYYRDDTYTDTCVSVPQWDSVQAPKCILTAFSHIHSRQGDVKRNAYLSQAILQIDSTKTAHAIALLPGEDAHAVFVLAASGFPLVAPLKVDLSALFNSTVFYNPKKCIQADQMVDGQSFAVDSFAATFVTSATTGPIAGIQFALGPLNPNQVNAVIAQGQKIPLFAEKYHYIHLAVFGIQKTFEQQVFRVRYADGSFQDFPVTINSWTASPIYGDYLLYESSFDNKRIWGVSLETDCQKIAVSLELPNHSGVCLVAVSTTIMLDSSWGLPVLNHTQGMKDGQGMFKFIWDIMQYWLQAANFDGYRIDSVQNFHPDFWRTMIHNYWRPIYPDKYLLGEAATWLPWHLETSEDYTNRNQGVGFDSVYDFALSESIREVFGKQASAIKGMKALIPRIAHLDERYDCPWNQVAFLDFYENEPFLEYAEGNSYLDKLPRIRLAAAFLFTVNRVPLLFSGNEYFETYGGYAPIGSLNRKPGYLFSDHVQQNPLFQDNLRYMKVLIAMRNKHSALRSTERLTPDKWLLQEDHIFGFIRRGDSNTAIVALFNNSARTQTLLGINLPTGLSGKRRYNFLLNKGGTYGAEDPTIGWDKDGTAMTIKCFQPWEAKIIQIN